MARLRFIRSAVVTGSKWFVGVLDWLSRLILLVFLVGVVVGPPIVLVGKNHRFAGYVWLGIAASAVVVACFAEGAYRMWRDTQVHAEPQSGPPDPGQQYFRKELEGVVSTGRELYERPTNTSRRRNSVAGKMTMSSGAAAPPDGWVGITQRTPSLLKPVRVRRGKGAGIHAHLRNGRSEGSTNSGFASTT